MPRGLFSAGLAAFIAVSPAPTFSQEARPDLQVAPLAATVAAPLVAAPDRVGYAFDRPRILAQQRVLGLAHGVSLLVSACMDTPARIDATLTAYLPWLESQDSAIRLAQLDLARHYFGARADEARWPDLLRALNLKKTLTLPSGSEELAAACATLPQALRGPRYNFSVQFNLHGLLAEATAAIEAELQWQRCRGIFTGDSRAVLDARYAVWLEINQARKQLAVTTLAADWPSEAPADSFEQWREVVRTDPLLPGRNVAECVLFAEEIKHPWAALRNVFAPPPEPRP